MPWVEKVQVLPPPPHTITHHGSGTSNPAVAGRQCEADPGGRTAASRKKRHDAEVAGASAQEADTVEGEVNRAPVANAAAGPRNASAAGTLLSAKAEAGRRRGAALSRIVGWITKNTPTRTKVEAQRQSPSGRRLILL